MNRILLVAKTEILEQRRQPAMLFILALNYVLWGSAFIFTLFAIGVASQSPELMTAIQGQAAAMGACDGESAMTAILRVGNSSFGALLFTNLPLFVAIMSAYSVLHDRTYGTLPFLMLAPLSRFQLLLGKLLGVLGIPYLLHLLFVGALTIAVRQLDVMAPYTVQFGGSTAWWVAFLLATPASGFLVGSLGTVISALSKDVRTSMQFTSFFIGILSLGFGFLLFDGIKQGLALQLLFVLGAGTLGLATLAVGSRIISRDISA